MDNEATICKPEYDTCNKIINTIWEWEKENESFKLGVGLTEVI